MRRLLCALLLCAGCTAPPMPPALPTLPVVPAGVFQHDNCREVSYNSLRAHVIAPDQVKFGHPLTVTVMAGEVMTTLTVGLTDGRSFTRVEPMEAVAVVSIVPKLTGTWQAYALADAAGGCLSASPLSTPIKVEP